MKTSRMLGNYVEHLTKENQVSINSLSEILNCTEYQVQRFFKGRTLLSFSQIMALSKFFDISVNDLLAGDEDYYKTTVVHYNQKFDKDNNREFVLDIIDNYVDLCDIVKGGTE